MKVLIVEDQSIIIKTLSKIILGIHPDTIIKSSTNTQNAEVLLKRFDFDLIVTDLDFDGEKRFSVLELAKEYGIRCIVYSGYYNMAFIKKAFKLDAVAFVSKLGDIEDLKYALINYKSLKNYSCNFCKNQNTPANSNEILFPDLKAIEELILDRLLVQKPRKEIAKELKITADSLNTYINRMTVKNDCNLLVLVHRYIIWKGSKK